MAKIFGIIKGKSAQTASILIRMGSSFKFGKFTYKTFKNGGLGHLFNDNINKEQPINDSGLSIVFCGKIFDYDKDKEILVRKGYKFNRKENDAEFILRSYQAYGLGFLEKLNGVFCFAIWDDKKKKLILANDRCGMSPMYYYHDKDKFIFGSEVKAIIAANEIKKEINWDGWRDFFAFGYLLGTKTLFKNIYSVPNGSYIVADKKGMKIKNYWDYDRIKVDYSKPFDYFVDKGVEVLKNAILRQTKGMKKAIVFLSGGYDSRYIACAIKKYTDIKIETVTTDHPSFAHDPQLAGKVAGILNIPNYFIKPPHNVFEKYFIEHVRRNDGMCAENMWAMPLADAMGHGKINFDGIAGDALIYGSALHRGMLNLGWHQNINDDKTASMLYLLMNDMLNYPVELPMKFFKKFVGKKIKPDFSAIKNELRKNKKVEYQITHFQIKNRTKNTISLDSQNITIRKIRCYRPFLDNDVVEFALSVPPEFKFKKNLYRRILLKEFPKIMQIPSSRDISPKRFAGELILKFRGRPVYLLLKKLDKMRGIDRKISAESLSRIKYLVELSRNIDIPSFVNRRKFLKEIEMHLNKNRDPCYFIIPILRYCIWHNAFLIGSKGLFRRYKSETF